jgi:hypothetical protein
MFIMYPYCLFISPLLFACYFIHFIRRLNNMDYGQLTDEIYSCDSKLVCQMHIRFLQLFAALISFNIRKFDLIFVYI